MFGLFGKKEAQPRRDEGQSPEFQELAAQFQPGETTVLAVTGANGFGGARLGKTELWRASLGLTAWMEEDGGEVCREETELVTVADDRLLDYLRRRAPRDVIIKCTVRRAREGRRLLLLDLPQPGFDPELKAILDEQKKPVTFWAEDLGTFTLNRQVDWFETEVDWLGQPVSLCLDQEEPEAMKRSQDTARALLAAAADWDRRVREYAVGQLLSDANSWAEDDGPITREQFMARMEPEAIQVDPEGGFEFWFGDGDMFFGHSIHVTGSLDSGPDWAAMEG